MFQRFAHNRLLRYAGLFTWAVIGLPLLLVPLPQPDRAGAAAVVAPGALQAWIAWVVFGASYAWLTRGLGRQRIRSVDGVLLAGLAGGAIAISYYSQSGLGSILLMVVASVLPWLLPVWQGVALVVLCEFVSVPFYVRGDDFSWG